MTTDFYVRFLFFLKNSCALKGERPTSDLLTSFAPRCALLPLVVGAYNKGYTVQPSARASPKFFFHFVPEKLRISLTLLGFAQILIFLFFPPRDSERLPAPFGQIAKNQRFLEKNFFYPTNKKPTKCFALCITMDKRFASLSQIFHLIRNNLVKIILFFISYKTSLKTFFRFFITYIWQILIFFKKIFKKSLNNFSSRASITKPFIVYV